MTERGRALVLVACVAAMLSACATFDPLDDTRIESEVKARLVGEKDANLTRVGVVSSKGTVYLSGTVVSPEQRARAAVLAREVTGVDRVVNALEVRPAPR
jgi:osmotically-inducible protein OsmY